MSKERFRVEDFMRDYDKLRSGRMLKTSFRRAVKLARLDLYESELAIVEDKWVHVCHLIWFCHFVVFSLFVVIFGFCCCWVDVCSCMCMCVYVVFRLMGMCVCVCFPLVAQWAFCVCSHSLSLSRLSVSSKQMIESLVFLFLHRFIKIKMIWLST